MRFLIIPYAVASGAIRKDDLLLESIRQHISLVLLELPITGMCLPTYGSFLRDGN
jgi:hypothetical protein